MTNIFNTFPRGRLVGFDLLENQIRRNLTDITTQIKYPPYDVEKISDAQYLIRIAAAGFSKNNITVTRDDGVIAVEGKLDTKSVNTAIYRGISQKDFSIKFAVGDTSEITEVTLENGILEILVETPEPKETKVTYDIKDGKVSATTRQNLFEQSSELMDMLRDAKRNGDI